MVNTIATTIELLSKTIITIISVLIVFGMSFIPCVNIISFVFIAEKFNIDIGNKHPMTFILFYFVINYLLISTFLNNPNCFIFT